MKTILTIITILLLVSCNKENKEERLITGNWISYYIETYNNNQPLAINEYNTDIPVKITKDSWWPLIEGNCTMDNGTIINDVDDHYSYIYDYNYSNNEIKLKAISTLYNGTTWTRYLKRQ